MHKTKNIPDLNLPQTSLLLLVQVDVDRKMGVDVSQLVLVALGNTDDHVVDQGANGAESGHILAGAVVQLDVDALRLRVRESDSQVTEVLDELATGTLDGDLAGLDVDLDC